MEVCPHCGKESKNKAGLSMHIRNAHPDKVGQKLDEKKAAEGLIKPEIITENKEIKEKPVKKEDEFVQVNESIDTDFVQVKKNPYRDLYPGEGEVINEWC